MCITLKAAELYNTIVGAWNVGQYTYLTYSNKPQNKSTDYNIMILPFPGLTDEITIDNMVKVPGQLLAGVLDTMSAKSAKYPTRSMEVFSGKTFTDGVYEYLSMKAQNLRDLGFHDMGNFYAYTYGEETTLLACKFVNTEIKTPPDIMVRYINSKLKLFVPLLDSHDGSVPDINDFRERIHQVVIFGDNEGHPKLNSLSKEELLQAKQEMRIIEEHLPPYFIKFESYHIEKLIQERVGYNKQRDICATNEGLITTYE